MQLKYLNPLNYVRPLGSRGMLNWMPDELYLKLCYRAVFHKKLDLKNPKTYNESFEEYTDKKIILLNEHFSLEASK